MSKTEAADMIAMMVRALARRSGREVTDLDVDETRSWYIDSLKRDKYRLARDRGVPATRTIWAAIRRQDRENRP